ncbi:hypothetical protein [Rhizobium sp. K102]|uniref:hypothetical protein n=1 Tax=Rhizobium sp. K102 TaxID=2918527 RepID=UPI001EFB507A|nr:hypothetical protein [Rhizobium sp. K102]ULR43568.1 hypothetical protein MHI61_20605 [Rhizobium sp. K102]
MFFGHFFKGRLGKQLDVALWHNHNTILPVRLIDGAALNPSGQIWRRCHHREWQYKQDPETLDDYEARQF